MVLIKLLLTLKTKIMSKYSKGQSVSYRGQSQYTGKGSCGANSQGVSRSSYGGGSGKITSVQRNTVRVSNSDGSSTTVHKNRLQ